MRFVRLEQIVQHYNFNTFLVLDNIIKHPNQRGFEAKLRTFAICCIFLLSSVMYENNNDT